MNQEKLKQIIQAYSVDSYLTRVEKLTGFINEMLDPANISRLDIKHSLLSAAYSLRSVANERLSMQSPQNLQYTINTSEDDLWAKYYDALYKFPQLIKPEEIPVAVEENTLTNCQLNQVKSEVTGADQAFNDINHTMAIEVKLEEIPVAVKKNTLTNRQLNQVKIEVKGADQAFKDKNYTTAIDAYTRALDINPKSFPALKGRALSNFEIGNYPSVLLDSRVMDTIDHLLATKLTAQVHLKQGNYNESARLFDTLMGRFSVLEQIEICNLFLEAHQLELAYGYCLDVVIKQPNLDAALDCMDQLGQQALIHDNAIIARACYQTLSRLKNPIATSSAYNMGLIEAAHGTYLRALEYFLQAKQSIDFKSLDQLAQQRTDFGILLCHTKLKNHPEGVVIATQLQAQEPLWADMFNRWVYAQPNNACVRTSESGSGVIIFIFGNPSAYLMDIIEPFLREEELTQNCITFFEHLNTSMIEHLNRVPKLWTMLAPSQLNTWVEYGPNHYKSGLLTMLSNPASCQLFITNPCFRTKITTASLNDMVPNGADLPRSALSCLMASHEGKIMVATEPKIYNKITSTSLNTLLVGGISVLCILIANDLGINLLCNNKKLRDKITTEGLDTLIFNQPDHAVSVSLLCGFIADPKLLALLCNDPVLCDKISTDGLNTQYTDGKASTSALYLFANKEQGRYLLEMNANLRGKITREGLIDAIGYAKTDRNVPALTWLTKELQRPAYQSLTLHHRLLWFKLPPKEAISPIVHSGNVCGAL